MTSHAMLSASGAKRWMTCTPSARLEAVLPEQKRRPGTFNYSEEGTMAHTLAELKLRRHYGQISAKEYVAEVDKIKETDYYTDEFVAAVEDYVLYVRSQIGVGDIPYFEQRVDFSEWVPDGFGTADVIILSAHKVRVIDAKFGRGIRVDAKDNPQLRLYALGGWYKYKDAHPNVTEVEYTIHQPRLESITTDATTLDKLLDWAEHVVKPKAKKAWNGTGEFIPGDHCQFCKAKPTCRARAEFLNAAAVMEFRAPPQLTEAEITKVLQTASKTKAWLNDVEEYALNRAIEDGELPEGFTIGKTTTKRKINDQEAAAVKLRYYGEDIYEPRTLKSVSQLEKLVGKGRLGELLGDLIVRPEGEPKLVPTKDEVKEEFS